MIWALLLIMLLPSWADAAVGTAAVDTWYVRPTGACANNGDGLAYGCAASAGATGAFISGANVLWTATDGVDNGDTLYVCGTHTSTLNVGSSAAGANLSPITIDFRCPSDTGSIRLITAMTEAQTAGNWTNESGNLWYLSVSSYTWKDPKRIWLDSVEIFPGNAKGDLGTREGTANAPIAQFWYDSGNSRIYLYATANPSTTFSLMESLVAGAATCAYVPICMNADANDFFEIINPDLKGGNLASFYLLGGDNIHIYGTEEDDSACQIGAYGIRGIIITDVSSAGTGNAATNIRLHDCTIDVIAPAHFIGYDWQWKPSKGEGVSVVYGVSNVSVHSNTIRNWGHALLNIAATLGTGTVVNSHFYDNTLEYTTVEYGRCFALDGAATGRASNNYVYRNDCNGQPIRSQFNGDANYVFGNLFRNQRLGTVDTTAVQSLDMEGYTGSVSQDNFIYNNTFLNNPYGPCISFRAGANTKSGYTVTNNLLYGCGGPQIAGAENIALYIANAASVGNQTFKNNYIYSTGQTSTVYYKATGATTVAAFQSACSGDTCSGNSATDPEIGSLTDGRTGASSPLRGAGLFWGVLCGDARGRPCWLPPDIGAYQSSSGDPAGPRAARQ